MSLEKPLASITEADLLALIENKEAEQKSIDYKEKLNLRPDPSKDELRKDVASFANSIGGHLIIGMKETDGFPTELVGLEDTDIEALKLQIGEVLQTKISPRIPYYDVHAVLLTNGKYAVVVEIGKSFVKPHQITINGNDFQFWARSSAGKYRLTIDELRTIILRSDTVADNVRRFRAERIGNVIAGDTPIPTQNGAKIILHLVPLTAFDPGTRYDMSRIVKQGWRSLAATLEEHDGSGPQHLRYNLDGLVTYTTYHEGEPSPSYLQVFSNGIIEAVDAKYLAEHPSKGIPLWFPGAEQAIYRVVRRGLALQCNLGIQCPIAVMVSVIGAKRCMIYGSAMPGSLMQATFSKDVMVINESLVERFDTDLNKIIKPILDSIWNAGGYESCAHYDSNGKWTTQR